MKTFSIGVLLESFKQPLEESLSSAKKLGAQGIQVYATYGERAPENMSTQMRKDFLHKVQDHGLCISALCGDLGKGFGNKELNPELIEKSKRILDMAKELETNIVTTHIGVVPDEDTHPRYKIMQEACKELSAYADSLDAHFAIETGPEKATVLKRFLDTLQSKGVAVNLDPANLIMVKGDDPVAAVYTLQDYIVHTHAKDGRMLYHRNAEEVYGVIPSQEDLKGPSYIELPLGEGDVPFPAYLKALKEIGYKGFLTIEREVGENPDQDILKAAKYLNSITF